MRDFFKSARFKIILLIFLILFAAFGYTRVCPDDNIIDNGISYLTTYAQGVFARIAKYADDYSYQFREKAELNDENEKLKKEVSSLRDKTVDYYNTKMENERFRKFYDIKKANNSLEFVDANVIGRDSVSDFGNFVIDKGSNAGVSVGDAVITENGFVGSVCKVNACSSYVRSILSADCKIGAVSCETSESGVLSGTAELAQKGLSRMEFISAESPIKPDEIVVTSGIGGMYPRNLKIGKVLSKGYDEYNSFYYANVEPFEDVKNIKNVFVITNFENKGKVEVLSLDDTE